MSSKVGSCYRLVVTATVVLLALSSVPLGSPSASAAAPGVTWFVGDVPEVILTFRDEGSNSSASFELPMGCTVASATVDIEGIGGFSDDVRSLDLDGWSNSSPDRAWRGWVQGNQPPSYPFWNPYSPRGTALDRDDYDDAGASDDETLSTTTGTGSPGRYPFHMFRFSVPDGNLSGLEMLWEGSGYCSGSNPTRGAELYAWRNDTRGWAKVDWYAKTEPEQDRVLEKRWTSDPGRFMDSDRQVFVLALGQPSTTVTGPNPWTAEGELHTDYVRVNATLEGAWMLPEDPALGIPGHGDVWSWRGSFGGRVTVGPSAVLRDAIQSAVDAGDMLPGNLSVQFQVNMSSPSPARVRLSNLSVTYDALVNGPPSWSSNPALTMMEDVDEPKVLDLHNLTEDDWSAARLTYTVANASTEAVLAVVEDDHFLSLYVQEAHWHGIASFWLNATDPWGLTTTSPEISVTILEVNDPPTVTVPGRQTARQGEPYTYTVEATDVDGDPVSFALDTTAFDIDPIYGEINFTPTNDQVGLHRVNVTVSDDRGGTTTVWMELDVKNVNDPPVITDPGPLAGKQGELFSHTFSVTDPDVVHGDILTWSLEGDDYYLLAMELHPQTGELVWRDPGNDAVGDHTFLVQVTDSRAVTDKVLVELTIANTNDPPVFAHIPDLLVFEDGNLTYHVLVEDPDLAVDPGEALTWTVDPPLFHISEDGTFAFVAGAGDIGEHTLEVSVLDRAGESHSQTFVLTVKGINHPPVIEPIEAQTVYEDQEWTLDIIVSDPDEGDVVQVTSRGAPFQVPVDGGRVTWTPQDRHGGVHLVTLEAMDPGGLTATVAFDLTVVNRNDPPQVEIRSPWEGDVLSAGDEILLASLAQDEEEDHLVVTWWWRYDDSPGSQWEKITTGATGYWLNPPDGRVRLKVEASDGESVTVAEVVFDIEAAPEEGTGVSGAPVAGMVLAVVAVLVVLLLLRGRSGGEEDDEEEEVPPGEADWEPVEPGKDVQDMHR